jgi:hypothetical protein
MSKLEGILNSKTLWLTPVQTMNDGTEVDHLFNFILPKVKEQIISETPKKQLINVETAFHYIDESSKFRIEHMPYCACFSDNGDLLSQWCMYADKGTGVSIGFDFNYFGIKNKPPHPNINLSQSIGLEAIIYDYNLQGSILYSIIKQNLSQEIPNAKYWTTILANLTIYSAIFKNRTFFSEQEKRIIYYFEEQHISQFSEKSLSGPFPYRYENCDYYRFELSWFTAINNHAISGIFIGPKCEMSKKEILEMLERYGIQITEDQVVLSESSYR